MHELAITQRIVEIVIEEAKEARVKRVLLRIGRESGVFPHAVRFAFDLCTDGTPAEGAALEIEEPENGELKLVEMEVKNVRDLRMLDGS